MTLYLIGIGLSDEKDITLKGLEAVKKCKKVFLESYTSKLQCTTEDLEKLYGKKLIIANREMVEQKSDMIISEKEDTALLIIGDPMGATTHIDMMMRAKQKGVNVKVINNASIMNAVGITGLQLYKFGKTTSIPFPQKGFEPETPYDAIKSNKDMHTLVLLDLRPDEGKFMTVNEGLSYLLKLEEKRKEKVIKEDMKAIGCARIGNENQKIKYAKLKELLKEDFGAAPHCIIIPGKLHFAEEEALEMYK